MKLTTLLFLLCAVASIASAQSERPLLIVTGDIGFVGHRKSGDITLTLSNTGNAEEYMFAGKFGIFSKRPSKYDSVKAIAPFVCAQADQRLMAVTSQIGLSPGHSATKTYNANWQTEPLFHPGEFDENDRPDNLVGCIAYEGPGGKFYHLKIFAFVRYGADADDPKHFDAEKIEVVKIVESEQMP